MGAESVLFATAPPTGIRPPPRPLALGGKLVAVRPSPGDRLTYLLPLPSDFPREGGVGIPPFIFYTLRFGCVATGTGGGAEEAA